MCNGDGGSVCDDEKFLEVSDGDGGTAMCVRFMLLSCALRVVKMANFMLCA